MKHKIYSAIVQAVNDGRLVEPFGTKEFRKNCPGFGEGTYQAFLYKHKIGNKKNYSVLLNK